jgi:hypothetical protein
MNFTILRGVAKRLPLYILLGNPPANVQMLLINLWQFCYRGSEGIGNPLAIFYKVRYHRVSATL